MELQQAAGQVQLVDDYIAAHYIQQEQEQEGLKKDYFQEQDLGHADVRNHPKKEPLMHLKVQRRCGGGRGQR